MSDWEMREGDEKQQKRVKRWEGRKKAKEPEEIGEKEGAGGAKETKD